MFQTSILHIQSISILYRLALVASAACFASGASILCASEDWVLSGTFLGGERSYAMFVNPNGEEYLLSEGDKIQDCILDSIDNDSSTLQCSTKSHRIKLRKSIGILEQASNPYASPVTKIINIDKKELTDYLDKKQLLVTEISFLPKFENEVMKGFSVSKVRPNSKPAALGIYNGDVITAVNGISATQTTEFFQAIKEL